MTSGADVAAQPEPAGPELERVRRAVLDGADRLWRDLPWRRTRDPWLVLVSEVMLQQTQAPRVVEPFGRFATRFPTPAACAAAGAADVVRAWAGLGYNRRALNLHRTSVVLVERHGGRVPADLDALEDLPGVGPYTARAVLAFGHGRGIGVVDTNVVRVLSRAVAGRPLCGKDAQRLADRLVPGRDAWRFNQAMFDLGACCCTARAPRCGACPLAASCRWVGSGAAATDPAAAGRRRRGAFAGSDRQGRGRLVAALRLAPVSAPALPGAAGWPDDEPRAMRIAAALVDEGIACWRGDALALA
jgi:A/G-specific adenine glycosylase